MGLHSRYRGLQSSPIHRPQSHHRLCQSTHSLPLTMKHRGIPSMACINGALSFHWPFGPLTFSHTQVHKHRVPFGVLKIGRRYGQFKLLDFAAFPGQAIHVVRTLVELGGCDDQRRRDESLMMFPWLARRLSTTSLSVIPPLFTALPCELVTHALNSIKGLCF